MNAETRIPTSLARHLGESSTTDTELRALAARAWRERGVAVFSPCDLDRMPAMARALVEGEAARIYGARRK